MLTIIGARQPGKKSQVFLPATKNNGAISWHSSRASAFATNPSESRKLFATPYAPARAFALAALALCAIHGRPAFAEKGEALDPAKAGIAVYPGAKADANASAFVRDSLGMTATAYRTGDDVAKVSAFYGKQAGIKRVGDATKENAVFSAGCKDVHNSVMKRTVQRCGYQVTVQNPWMDTKTGKLSPDTLITIVKQDLPD
jgi:hypothetical protein